MPTVGQSNQITSPTQVGADVVKTGNIKDGEIVNADISASAAIALSKITGAAASGANSDITSLSGLSTVIPVTEGGIGAATETAHGVLLGEGTSPVTATTAGTAGQVLKSNGAAADPSFQDNIAIATMIIATIFETAGRFLLSNASGGTTTFNTTGLVIATGATGGAFADAKLRFRAGANLALEVGNPVFSCHLNMVTLNAATNSANSFFGVGEITISAGAAIYTSKHFGFKIIKTGGVVTLYGTVGNGTTGSATSALTTLADGDSLDLIARLNASGSVDYYWRKNGGALSAAVNVATNLPTTIDFGELHFELDNNNTATAITITAIGASYSR